MPQPFESKLGTPSDHDRFRELCASYGSGSLTDQELAQLDGHLVGCPECASLLQGYSALIRHGLPILVAQQEIAEVAGLDAELLEAKTQLLAKLDQGGGSRIALRKDTFGQHEHQLLPRGRSNLLAYTLALIVAICAGIGGYILGDRKAHGSAGATIEGRQQFELQPGPGSIEALNARNQEIKRLSVEAGRLRNELLVAKKLAEDSYRTRSEQASALSSMGEENASLKAERNQATQHYDDAQAKLAQISKEMDQLRSEHEGSLLQNADLEKRLDAVKIQLHSLNETISEQQRLLAADVDIRELMGARDLLLADVFDVDQNGRNKQPFGRVFYTKNKSLIFYAFDLDRQPTLRNAGAFQAWGAKAADNGKGAAFNLGIFYMDNETMRRWVLKCDNPKILAQIDSVFVTVEPEGGSDRPRGKQLLFASLRGEPNHP